MRVRLERWMLLVLVLCALLLLLLVTQNVKKVRKCEKLNTNSSSYTPVDDYTSCEEEKPQYLPNFKNPCWYAKQDGNFRLKCVPYYHILGVTKSSTTDLSYRIQAHKDVATCTGCYVQKESFYWSRKRYGYLFSDVTPVCNFSCFLQMFNNASQKIEQITTQTGYHNMITGDATPSDFTDFRWWTQIPQNAGLEKPVILTPHLMRHVYTDPKFILVLKNPTERLYSDYFDFGGSSAADFHEAASQAAKVEEACMKNHTVEQCLFSFDIAKTLRTRIFMGCYSVYMREWLKVFPREQFLILRTEDRNQDPKAQLRKVYNYLKLNYTEDWLSSVANIRHQRVTQKKLKQGPMLEKTRTLLDKFYSRYNKDLADILQDKRFLWLS